MKDLKIAMFLPCYKRHQYTNQCIEALEEAQGYGENVHFYMVDDGSNDGITPQLLEDANLPNKTIVINEENVGTRNTLIDFIQEPQYADFDFIGRIDNDCKFPRNWLIDMLEIFDKSDVQVLSPNVFPSNAAHVYGTHKEGCLYRPSKIVGGLWFMYKEIVNGIEFTKLDVKGIIGAFNILKQILLEKEPIVGWASNIVVQDLGHWSGKHPDHIICPEHLEYYEEVGRKVSYA